MANLKSVRLPTCLMQYDQVSAVVGATRLDQLLRLIVASVDTLRIGKDELDFFGELFETRAGRVRSSDYDFGIMHARPLVLVVHLAGDAVRARVLPVDILLQVERFFAQIRGYKPIFWAEKSLKQKIKV